jgi:hypothetical protein
MTSGTPPSRRAEPVESPIDINETEARGAMRVGLIRQLVVSLCTAVALMGTVWVLSVSR